MSAPRNNLQIRRNNIRSLLTSIKENGPISKRDLQKFTGLSWGAVSSLTSKLYDYGYVVSAGKQETNVGRKPFELDINSEDFYIVGIDLNLSGLCGVITDIKGRIIQEWIRLFASNDYECIMNTLLSLLDEILVQKYAHKSILGIGLAVQGNVDVEGGISVHFPQIRHWNNVPLKKILEERYGYFALLMHDPNCLMIAEQAFGTSFVSISQNAILLRIDNGIGMSIMSNGQLHLGFNGKAGEIGHIPMNKDGPVCLCGNRGCLEGYASGNGLVRRFVEQVNQGRKTNADIENIGNLGYKILAVAAQNGDELCMELFRQMGEYLGLALSILYNIFNPDLVVLYGDLTAYRKLFYDSMKRQLDDHLYNGIPAKLVFSQLGRNAAALGAAMVVSDKKIEELNISDDDMEDDSEFINGDEDNE